MTSCCILHHEWSHTCVMHIICVCTLVLRPIVWLLSVHVCITNPGIIITLSSNVFPFSIDLQPHRPCTNLSVHRCCNKCISRWSTGDAEYNPQMHVDTTALMAAKILPSWFARTTQVPSHYISTD